MSEMHKEINRERTHNRRKRPSPDKTSWQKDSAISTGIKLTNVPRNVCPSRIAIIKGAPSAIVQIDTMSMARAQKVLPVNYTNE